MLLFLRTNLGLYYNVYIAENGNKALSKIKDIPVPDLIISEVIMPELDGFQFYKIAGQMKDYSHIPFIFLSANTNPDNALEGLSLGAIDYIYKPFSIKLLIRKIESIISLSRKQKEAFYNSFDLAYSKMDNIEKEKASQKEVFENNVKIYHLTAREKEIIEMIIEGLSYKEISSKLNLSEKTVITHRQNIFYKVDVNNKMDLIKKLCK